MGRVTGVSPRWHVRFQRPDAIRAPLPELGERPSNRCKLILLRSSVCSRRPPAARCTAVYYVQRFSFQGRRERWTSAGDESAPSRCCRCRAAPIDPVANMRERRDPESGSAPPLVQLLSQRSPRRQSEQLPPDRRPTAVALLSDAMVRRNSLATFSSFTLLSAVSFV